MYIYVLSDSGEIHVSPFLFYARTDRRASVRLLFTPAKPGLLRNMDFDVHGRLDFEAPEVIRAEQTRLLNEHLAYCRANSPYYRRILSGRPDRPVTLESLAELPLTGKTELAEFNDRFVALPPEEIADISFTSGTTGRPCRISYSENDLSRLGYNDAKGFLAAGIRAGDRVLLTCTIDRCFIAGLAYYSGVIRMGAAAIRNGLNTLESHAEIMHLTHPCAIVGVPSFLAKLGEYLTESGYDCSSVRTLVCIGEPLRTRDLALTPLGRKLDRYFPGAAHSTYASSEIVTSFTECSAQAGGHPPADLAVVEIVDPDGHPLPPGKVGEVVVTPLRVTGMPLIRFRTGDVSFLIPEEHCACGRNTRRLGPILGRKAQMLKIRGTTLFPNSFFTVLDSLEDVSDYYLEVTGSALSDEVRVFAAVRNPDCTAQFIAEQLYKRIRIHVPVEIIPYEQARAKISRQSRKPVRFFDLRTP